MIFLYKNVFVCGQYVFIVCWYLCFLFYFYTFLNVYVWFYYIWIHLIFFFCLYSIILNINRMCIAFSILFLLFIVFIYQMRYFLCYRICFFFHRFDATSYMHLLLCHFATMSHEQHMQHFLAIISDV